MKVPYSTKFRSREFAIEAGTPLAAFQVAKEEWSLRAQLPRDTTEAVDAPESSARLAFADLTMTHLTDQSFLGRAVYETAASNGRFLTVESPALSSLLWVTVDSNPVTPFRSPSGAWSIPLPDRRPVPRRTDLENRPEAAGPIGQLVIARTNTACRVWRVPTLVSIFAPGAVTIDTDAGGLEPVTMAQLESARADGLARSFADLVARLDRSSGRDHEKLVSLLINHEMALRSAERSAQASDPRDAISPTVGSSGVFELTAISPELAL